MPHRLHLWLRRTSWLLMGTAVLAGGWAGTLSGYEGLEQHRLLSDWDRGHAGGGGRDIQLAGDTTFLAQHPHLAHGEPVFKLSMPGVRFSALVTEGSQRGILSQGPGHDEHTGYPGEGNLILVGSHNGFSLSWNDIRPGDEVNLDTADGRHHYRVERRSIVDADDRGYIDRHRDVETLVLVTCWPLWQGAFAHQRLVIEATPVAAS